ncbi:MAG TPA: hypothetical protein VF816_05855 [Rhodocyclaceae bacterium]
MPAFENYIREAEEIEREITRRGLVLGIDWTDEVQVHALAREALDYKDAERTKLEAHGRDAKTLAKIEIFGLAQLMLSVMRQSADEGMFTHGGDVWKTLARALWKEAKGS